MNRTIFKQRRQTADDGFTIVELLIATMVLSFILLLATSMITSIGNLYYKGVNQSRLQDTARSVANDLAQRVELQGGSQPPATDSQNFPYGSGSVDVGAVCIGSTRYSYVDGMQIGTGGAAANQIPHVLWRDTNSSGTCTALDLTRVNPPNSGADGTELMVSGGSIDLLFVDTTSPPYTVTVDLAYGDRTMLSGSGQNTTCKSQKGDQFCAVANITTAATPRTN